MTARDEHFTKEMTVGEAVDRCPETFAVFQERGVHFCAGCYLTLRASIAEGAAWNGIRDLEGLLQALHRAAAGEEP